MARGAWSVVKDIVTVVGGGLAGSECALQLADRGIRVKLVEQRPGGNAPAHHTDALAELVCSNSLKSLREESAAGLLKYELKAMGSHLIRAAHQAAVPTGGALAVDRTVFSQIVTQEVEDHPLIELVREEVTAVPEGPCVIAAGPLCSPALFSSLCNLVGMEHLSFYRSKSVV